MRRTRSVDRRAALGVVAAIAITLVASGTPAAADPLLGVHEGSGYAVAVGPGATSTCSSTAAWLPTTVSATTSPLGVTTASLAVGQSTCAGNLPISPDVVIEAWSADRAHFATATCAGMSTCSVVIPPGWGTFYIMPSSFWEAPVGSTWFIKSEINNDGYCNYAGSPHKIVCRAWATGVS